MTLSFSKTDLLLTVIPLLLIIPVLAHGQQEQAPYQNQRLESQQPIPDRFIPFNLTGPWELYNSTSGSQSTINFSGNDGGNYSRILNGNVLTGMWQSQLVIEQRVQLCPTLNDEGIKWTEKCIQVGILVENPHRILFTDGHGGRMELSR
jgi:hypothetical protein